MAGRVRGEPWPSGAKDTPGGYPHIWSEDPGPLPEEEGILGPLRLSSMPASFDLTSGSWPQHPSPQPCHTPQPDLDTSVQLVVQGKSAAPWGRAWLACCEWLQPLWAEQAEP